MPEPNDRREWAAEEDPARHFENGDPSTRVWRFRFVPPSHLQGLDIAADRGLERLIYLETLISDE